MCHREEAGNCVNLLNWELKWLFCRSHIWAHCAYHVYSVIFLLIIWVFLPFISSSRLPSHFPQTNIGSILAAVNPYKQIAGLYDGTAVDLYSKHQMGELPPHIFAVANECYRCLWKRHDSQCVLIRWGENNSTFTTSVFNKHVVFWSRNRFDRSTDVLGVLSGESGAGKTESTKLLLKFLSVMSQNSAGTPPSERTTRVEQALVQSRYCLSYNLRPPPR